MYRQIAFLQFALIHPQRNEHGYDFEENVSSNNVQDNNKKRSFTLENELLEVAVDPSCRTNAGCVATRTNIVQHVWIGQDARQKAP